MKTTMTCAPNLPSSPVNADLSVCMATSAGALPSASGPTPRALMAANEASKSKARRIADLALQPGFNAAAVSIEFLSGPGSELTVKGLMESLTDSIEDLSRGDLSHLEAMLFAQAHALQAVFLEMARRAAKHERTEHREASLRMALKAQNQCRMTLETLATIKSPPIVIARQANINQGGQQQINNEAEKQRPAPGPAPARARRVRAKRTIGEGI
jgi:hypothetical protein